jgi:glycosyltransferase involved in cell wall biosynthesis
MRIVFVSPALPYSNGRADGRLLANLLTELARRGHDVTCVSSHEEPEEAVGAARAAANQCGYELIDARLTLRESYAGRKLASAHRPYSEHARSTTIQAALNAALQPGYDVLHIEDPFLARAVAEKPRRVVYLHHLEVVDLERRTDRTAAELLRQFQLRRATSTILSDQPRVIAASERVAREAVRWHRGRIPVVPVAFDAHEFTTTSCTEPTVGVIGSMHWYPSRSAAERVLQRLWGSIHTRVPEARLLVAGWGSDRYLSDYFPCPGAELLGPVANADDFFARCSVLLYPPERGTGMKLKVLEAMARGVAVVSNEEGLEGLASDAPVRRGDTDAELVTETSDLLIQPSNRAELASEGRSFVKSRVNAATAADRLLEAYETLGLTISTPRTAHELSS